jgi:predicted RNase H-like nuclease (RuvC/YqgF family)
VNRNIDIGETTSGEVKELKSRNIELKDKVDELLIKQNELKGQLEPFVEFAQKTYPNTGVNEALSKLQEDIEKQKVKIEGTDKKVNTLEKDVATTKEMASPAKLTFHQHRVVKDEKGYKLTIVLKSTKLIQLGELDFTVTCEDMSGDTKILSIGTEPENYYIFGAYEFKISTNNVQAKLKYKPAGVVEFPNVVVVLNKKGNVVIEGNYDLVPTRVQLD